MLFRVRMPRRNLAVLAGLALTASLFVGLNSLSQAQEGQEGQEEKAGCKATKPTLGTSTETGGTQIKFSVKCDGKGQTVDPEVTVNRSGTLLFQMTDTAKLAKNGSLESVIHLPPPPVPPGAEVCIEMDDAEPKCAPT